MASSPTFVGTPQFTNIVLNATNAGDGNYINPTTVATILTMSSAGRIDTVYIRSLGTNASTVVRFWLDTNGSGGANNRLIQEVSLAATTSSEVAALGGNVWSARLVLPANAVLRGTVGNTAVTNGVCVSVEWGTF